MEMANRESHPPTTGLGDGLGGLGSARAPRENSVKTKLDNKTTGEWVSNRLSRSQLSLDFGNGVRPRTALGVKDPIWRLGALVSLPDSIGKVILVQKPDRSLSLRAFQAAACDRRENVSEKRARSRGDQQRVGRTSPAAFTVSLFKHRLGLKTSHLAGRPVGLTTGPSHALGLTAGMAFRQEKRASRRPCRNKYKHLKCNRIHQNAPVWT